MGESSGQHLRRRGVLLLFLPGDSLQLDVFRGVEVAERVGVRLIPDLPVPDPAAVVLEKITDIFPPLLMIGLTVGDILLLSRPDRRIGENRHQFHSTFLIFAQQKVQRFRVPDSGSSLQFAPTEVQAECGSSAECRRLRFLREDFSVIPAGDTDAENESFLV